MSASLAKSVREVNERDLVVSIIAGFIPTVGLFVSLAITIDNWEMALSLLGWVLFTWSAYRREGIYPRIGAGLFWLSVEAFLAPGVMLIFLISRDADPSELSVLLGNSIVFVATWIVGWGVGIVLLLVSRRFEG